MPSDGEAASQADLVYSVTEMETLVFAPRNLADEVRGTRAALATAATWGDARRVLSRERYGELRDWLFAEVDPDPADHEVFPHDALPGQGAWPQLLYSDVEDWLPAEVLDVHGVRYEGMMDRGINLPADSLREIIETLRTLGIRCEEDPGVADLFGDGYVD